MTKSWILKRAFVVLGACLSLAWFGAIDAAQRQDVSATDTLSTGEDLVLLKSDQESVIVELRTPAFQIDESWVDGSLYHIASAEGCGQTDEVGQPQLPVRGTLLGIPATAEYSLRVIDVEQETVSGQFNVYPVSRPVLERDGEGNPTQLSYALAPDRTTYASNSFYPAAVAEVGSDAYIRDQRVVQLRFFPLLYNPVTGELRHSHRIRVELRFSYPGGQPSLSAPWEEDDSFRDVLQNAMLNYDSARQWRDRPSAVSFSQVASLGQGDPSYKVLVDEDGIYQLTYADLQGAGMDLGSVHPLDFELHNRGEELAIYVADEDDDGQFEEEDYILFFGQQVTTTYTDTNVYWLSTEATSGLRMPEQDGSLSASMVLTYFNTTGRWEENLHYVSWIPEPATIPSEEELDHWFGDYVRAPDQPTEQFLLALDNLATSSPPYSSTLRGSVTGQDTVPDPYDHRLKVYLNGHLVEDALWSGQGEYQFETDEFPHSYLLHGSNTISVESVLTNPGVAPSDLVHTNWFEIDYRRTYTVENDGLLFDGEHGGIAQFEVGGFLTDTVEVFDVTDPFSVTHFYSTAVEESGSYTLKFEDSIAGEQSYLALSRANYQSPLAIIEDSPSDLQNTSNGADYILVTHPDFHDAVLPLRDLRASEGLRSMVVDVRDVYDEFNYGIFHPGAMRDFLAYAYGSWVPPAPSYVLLVGDGNWDFKDHLGRGEPNYIPPYLLYADVWLGETAADNRYVCVSGDDELPDMFIGRLPAQTVTQANTMVSKTLNYETSLPEGDWRKEVLFLADVPDTPGDPQTPNHFWSLSDNIADNHLPPPDLYIAEKMYYDIESYETVKGAIFDAFDNGRLFVNYVGHGAVRYWGGYPPGPFLSRDDVATLDSSGKTPIVLVMACMEGHFISPSGPGNDRSCLAETFLRAGGKASVASWSPVSFGTSSGQHYLHTGFYDAVFRDHVYELGPATNLGKLNLYQHAGGDHRELIDTYMVFGDPALRLPIENYVAFLPLGLKGY